MSQAKNWFSIIAAAAVQTTFASGQRTSTSEMAELWSGSMWLTIR